MNQPGEQTRKSFARPDIHSASPSANPPSPDVTEPILQAKSMHQRTESDLAETMSLDANLHSYTSRKESLLYFKKGSATRLHH